MTPTLHVQAKQQVLIVERLAPRLKRILARPECLFYIAILSADESFSQQERLPVVNYVFQTKTVLPVYLRA